MIKTLSPLREWTLGVTHNKLTDGDEIVRPDWGYNYDVDFFTGVPDPMDWRVEPEWVGKPARKCVGIWQEFIKPIHTYDI